MNKDYYKKKRYKYYISVFVSLILFMLAGGFITFLSYLLCG